MLIEQEPLAPALDRVINVVYHWRLLLAVGLVPLFLAAMALSFGDTSSNTPATDTNGDIVGDDAISAFESMVRSVVPADGVTAPPGESDDTETGEPTGSAVPALPSPATTDGAAPTTETTSQPTTEAPTTTEPPTTEPPTTAQPTTIVQCLVSVRRRTALRAEPDGDAEQLARVSRGTYGGFGSTNDGTWYQIDFQGTIGWVKERSVDEIQGVC